MNKCCQCGKLSETLTDSACKDCQAYLICHACDRAASHDGGLCKECLRKIQSIKHMTVEEFMKRLKEDKNEMKKLIEEIVP